jgi:DNA invertase Pin-like site-specific DNA recombinase
MAGAVVLWKLSDLVTRFRAVLTMLAAWGERGVRVVIVSNGIDLHPETNGATFPLLRALAETELEFRRDRQKRGIAVAKARGNYPGRKPGTTKEKPRRAATLRGKGYTVAEIAEMLGVSKRTAFRYLGSSQDTKSKVASKGPSHEN